MTKFTLDASETRPYIRPFLRRSSRNICWLERHCHVPEGKYVGQPLKIADYMRADFEAIYDNPHGTRRAIISRGRKNAKTTEAALIILLHLCGPEMKKNSQLYSTALSRDQAAVLFALAAKIIRMSVTLNPHIHIRDSNKQLLYSKHGTIYRALSAEASTSFGLSPIVVIHDELGQVRGPLSHLYEAMETATAAQEDPLSVIISTQAPTDNDLLSVLIDDAAQAHDPKVVLRLDTSSPEADPFDESTIRQANPAFDIFMNQKEVLSMAADARRMPTREAEYRNYVLNQRVEIANPFITKAVWLSCGDEPTGDFIGKPVYCGLDLSSTNDLTAFVMIAAHEGKWHVRPIFWLPEDGLRERARVDKVAYDTWHNQGLLETTPGRSIEYEWIAQYLRGVFDRYDIRRVAFDRAYFKFLRPWLEKADFTSEELERFVEYGQGFMSMSPALRDLESVLLSGKMAHGNHPVLTMCCQNCVVTMDPAGNRKLDKKRARGRIDGMISLAMAVAVANTEDLEPEPEYNLYIL